MASVNIRRDVSDPFYRYKMERLQSKIEGKGNGIKTVVANLPSVAGSLARPPNYLIKWFGFELGAQTNQNPKDDRWIINGAHESSKLQDSLDGFINKFVLCKSCKNPETEFKIKEGRILLDCKACGQRTQADIRHKLSGFILKNESTGGKKKNKEKLTRRDRAKAETRRMNLPTVVVHMSPTLTKLNPMRGMLNLELEVTMSSRARSTTKPRQLEPTPMVLLRRTNGL